MSFDYSKYPTTNPAQSHLLNHLQINGITNISVDRFINIAANSRELYHFINEWYVTK